MEIQIPDHVCLGPGCKECQIARLGIKETKKKKFKSDPKHNKMRSRSQESKIGKDYKAAGFEDAGRVPGSGMISTLPGDIDPGEWFLGEAKETRTGKMIVDPEWYDKIEAQAKQMGRPWWILHTWTAEDMGRYRKLVTLPEATFFELLRRLKAAEGELDALLCGELLQPSDHQEDTDND